MQRDMDLVRQILFALEDKQHTHTDRLMIEGYEQNVISYHVALLEDAGLVANTTEAKTFGGGHHFKGTHNCFPDRLTWEGHEFLETSRDQGRWEKAKGIMIKKGGGLSFSVMQTLLVRLMSEAVLSK